MAIQVEVAYATPDQQIIEPVTVADGCTVEQAIQASQLLIQFPEIKLDSVAVGIFSKKVSLQQQLRKGDRVEIYRPLLIDPKQARRLRAKKKNK